MKNRWVCLEVDSDVFHLRCECFLAIGGNHEKPSGLNMVQVIPVLGLLYSLGSSCYNGMGVGPSKAKAIDTDVLLFLWPWNQSGRNFNAPFVEGDFRVALLEIVVRQDILSLKHERRLDEAH